MILAQRVFGWENQYRAGYRVSMQASPARLRSLNQNKGAVN